MTAKPWSTGVQGARYLAETRKEREGRDEMKAIEHIRPLSESRIGTGDMHPKSKITLASNVR